MKNKQPTTINKGQAVFRLTIKKQLLNKKAIKNTLQKEQIWLILEYKQQKWSQIFSQMISTSVRRINLISNYCPQIIKDISNVRFSQMTDLILNDNKISNIEALSAIQFQNLQYLQLEKNKIVKINSLRKLKALQLKRIVLCKNYVSDYIALQQIKFTNLKLDLRFFLDQEEFLTGIQNQSHKHNKMSEDLSKLMKIQTEKLQKVYLFLTKKNKMQLKVQQMYKKKHVSSILIHI